MASAEAHLENSPSAVDRSTAIRVAVKPHVDEEHIPARTHGDAERTVARLRYGTFDVRRLSGVIEPAHGVSTECARDDVGDRPTVGRFSAAGRIARDAGWDAEIRDEHLVWRRRNEEAVRATILRPTRERCAVELEDAGSARLRYIQVVLEVDRHESGVAQPP